MPARKSWNYANGETQSVTIRGPAADISALYELYKMVAGSNPDYDALDFDPAVGVGTLTYQKVEDGAVQYELLANEFMQPVQYHSFFSSLGADKIAAVLKAFYDGKTVTQANFAEELQVTLMTALLYGVTDVPESGYVLRSTQNCSKRSALKASYTGVNTVVTPPAVSAVNTMIGNLPTGEWLKKSPNVTMIGPRKWRITEEWWWAEQWPVWLGGKRFA